MQEDDRIPTLEHRLDTPQNSVPADSLSMPSVLSELGTDEEAIRAVIAPVIQSRLRQWASELEDQIVNEILSANTDD